MLILDSCTSTQTVAKMIIDDGFSEDSKCIVSKKMTAGLTRKPGIKWYSPNGNLYLTIIYKKSNLDLNIIPAIAAYTVYKFLKSEFNLDNIKIKWPNDILINNKKICGILSDNYKEYYLIGIGINLLSYPKKTLNFAATSIKNESDFEFFDVVEMAKIIHDIFIENINFTFFKYQNFSSILNFLNKNFYKINQPINIIGLNFKTSARFIGVNEKYEMILEDEFGKIKLYSNGEISYN